MKNTKKLSLFLISMCIFLGGIILLSNSINTKAKATEKENLENAINRAVTNYYAVNGVYPMDIEILKDKYGINYSDIDYKINYVLFASNIYPDITIVSLK